MKKLIVTVMLLSFSLGFSQTKEIDSLTIQLAFQKQDSSKVTTSVQLIKALYKANDINRASEFINQTEILSNELNYTKGLAEVTYYKGLIYSKKDDYINAINTLKKSQQLFLELKDTLNVARIYGDLGLLEIKRGNYNEGLVYSLTAIQELEKRNLTEELAKNYKSLGEAYLSIKDYDKAVEYNLKTLRIEEQKPDTDDTVVVGIYKDLAMLYAFKNENRKAIEYYNKLFDYGFDLSDEEKASILPLMANEYLMLNNTIKAKELFTESLELSKKANNTRNTILSLIGLAKINIKNVSTYNYKQANYQLEEALKLSQSLGDDAIVLELYKVKMDFDSARGKYQSAFEWQKRYFELKEKIDKESKPVIQVSETPLSQIEIPQLVDDLKQPETKKPSIEEKSFFYTNYNLFLFGLLAAFIVTLIILISTLSKKNFNNKSVQDLEEANKKLELQNEAILEQTKHLENINKVKDKLFSIVSHDLKDSMSSINGFIDLLKDGSLSRQEFEKLIPELSENASNASLLLFNLLNWSKSQMQSLEPNPSLFDVQEIFEDKVKLIEQRADAKGISIVDHTLRDFVYADKSMIEIVVQNLLTNAVKFTKAGDTITVSNHISNGHAILSVADTGVGIPKENLDKLFKANTLTTIGTKNEKGTGLGLSICKELVELNNGKIWVESTLNVGTTFYVQLPKSKPNN